MNKRRPKFRRQDQHKRKEVKGNWRRPRGLHSKIKLGVHGKAASPCKGYQSPKTLRGTNKEGKPITLIYNATDLKKVPNGHVALIAHIGNRKKLEVLNAAKQNKITLANVKNIEEKINQIQQKLKERKNKETKQQLSDKIKTETKKPEEKTAEETKKDYDKLLTKPT